MGRAGKDPWGVLGTEAEVSSLAIPGELLVKAHLHPLKGSACLGH